MMDVYLPLIICFLAGVGLMVAEVFMPGFGLPGISGIILSVASIVIAWTNFGGLAGLGMTVVVIAVIAIVVSAALRSASSGRISKSKLILREAETPEEGYSASGGMEGYLGREGVTTTVLRPAGVAEFDGTRLNVMTDGEYVQPQCRVAVISVEGAKVVVKRVENA